MSSCYVHDVNRARVWPDFDDALIVYEDEDLIVVDKPAGVPSQAPDPDRPDDLVTRLRAHLAARGEDTYLGVHQRLDRDTSGVIVMARRREANASLAAQFEGRRVEKQYYACVTGWRRGQKATTLDDMLAPGDAGRMRVVGRNHRGGQRARTHVRVLRVRGERTLLELTLETGRMHQARVQLANVGARIAGDALYGGPAAPRLLLHASAIALTHPTSGASVRFAAPEPPEMEQWMAGGDRGEGIYDDDLELGAAIARAFERRFGLGRADQGSRATTAFRIINEGGDALPRLAVDLYGDHLVAQLYEDGALWTPTRRDRVLDALAASGVDGIYLKVRPKQASVLVDTRREDLAPNAPVRGTAAPDEVEIMEEGIPYGVRLGDGLATGIYLDQRNNRRRLRGLAEGKRVLNLFSYTCAFSVAAAKGGARATVSVDASQVALERGRANLARAGIAPDTHAFCAEDALGWMARARAKRERFEVIVLDPPSFSTTKQTTFSAESDYVSVAAQALALLAPGGVLLACANHRGILRVRFRRFLHDAARAAGREVVQLKDLPDSSDFPPALGRESHLKSALVTLAG